MERGIRFFWGLIAVLVAASVFFGLNAESRRRAFQKQGASLETGEIVRLSRVVDGDTVVVANAAGDLATVRLLGIKAFDPGGKDVTAAYGKLAVEKLGALLEDQAIRVLLNNPPKDKHGRTIAELFVGERSVAVELVRQGLALVYTAYPFPAMSQYLEEQETAKADRLGLWRNPETARRADRLRQEWSRRASE